MLSVHQSYGQPWMYCSVPNRKSSCLRNQYEQSWLGVLAQAQGLIDQPPFIWHRFIGGAILWAVTGYQPTGAVSLDALTEMILIMGLDIPVAKMRLGSQC